MRITTTMFGAVACLMGASYLQATPEMSSTSTEAKTKYPSKSRQAHYYITSVPATGSHIPLVVRKYKDSVSSISPTATYSAPQLDQTGQINVGAQIVSRDPALAGFSGASRR